MPKAEPKPKPEPQRPARAKPDQARARAFAIEAARLLGDDKCEDVLVLNVHGVSQITDFIVIGTGTSDRQMRSTLSHLEELGETQGYKAFHTSEDDRGTWLLGDFVDVIVHLFEPNTRAHYDLEMLWGDAERIPWERPAAPARAPSTRVRKS